MFALELALSQPSPRRENVLVRKPSLVIGASNSATLQLEELAELDYQLSISRELGRKFRVTPVSLNGGQASSSVLDGVYENEAEFTLGSVGIRVTVIDGDLALRENEPPDRAGVRILRQASANNSPYLPALMLRGEPSGIISFSPEQVIYVGRGTENAIQVDAVDVSYKHARIGFESGSFWVEDLGSTNGTFFEGQQISTRTTVPAGTPIVLGRDTTLIGIANERDLDQARQINPGRELKSNLKEKAYPVLLSLSEVVRPSRMVLDVDSSISLGRDPKNDLWLGAPHVSREHCVFSVTKTGEVIVKDHSTNGTVYDEGVLARGEELGIRNKPRVFDFGQGITVALCFSEDQEKEFLSAEGDPGAFLDLLDAPAKALAKNAKITSGSGNLVSYSERIKAVYQSLSFFGQVLLVFTVLAALVILMLIAGLLTQVFI